MSRENETHAHMGARRLVTHRLETHRLMAKGPTGLRWLFSCDGVYGPGL